MVHDARECRSPGGHRTVARQRYAPRVIARLTVVAALCVVLAGCGGLSHSGYVSRADAICSAYTAAAKPLPKPKAYTQVLAFVDTDLPLYEAALTKLEALKPPSQDKADVEEWLAQDRRVAAALRALGEGALRHNYPAVTTAIQTLLSAGIASSQAADTLGLQVCGR
jgi:hypothetical protein